jgi:hypothetical protein
LAAGALELLYSPALAYWLSVGRGKSCSTTGRSDIRELEVGGDANCSQIRALYLVVGIQVHKAIGQQSVFVLMWLAVAEPTRTAKGRERNKLIRAGDVGTDPAADSIPGHAVNRLCPLGLGSARSGHFPPRVWNRRNQAAVQSARACVLNK